MAHQTETQRLEEALEHQDCDLLSTIDPDQIDPDDQELLEKLLLAPEECFREWAWTNLEYTAIASVPIMFESQNLALWQDLKERVDPEQVQFQVGEYLLNQEVDPVFLHQLHPGRSLPDGVASSNA